ncbi:MAG: proline dehydrogenase family protein [Flavobacteriaceae bacterium]
MYDLFQNTEVAYELKKTSQIRKSIFLFRLITKHFLVRVLSVITLFFLKIGLPIKWLLKATIYEQFCGGISINECSATIKKMKDKNVYSILDYSIESLKNEKDFENACEKKLTIIKLSKENNLPFSVFKPTSLGSYELFKMKSSKETLNNNEKLNWLKIEKRFDKIFQYAKKHKIKVLVDAEEYEVQNAIDELVLKMMKKYNDGDEAVIYNTVQLYRRDRIEYLKKLIELRDGYRLGFKLVRGAYMEKERQMSIDLGYESPICKTKRETDNNFNEALKLLFNNISGLDIFVASHNEESNYLALDIMKKSLIKNNSNSIWFCQLFGMGDHITFNLSKKGYNVAKILPFGPVKNLIPYLIRRAQENTSVDGQTNRELNLLKKELSRRNN